MASRLNPYLSFNGNARQALEFYKSIFGGELVLNTFGSFGAPDASIADNIMHGMLEAPNGFTLMGADSPPDDPSEYNIGNGVSISLSGDNVEELRGYWAGLSVDGTITVPLEKQMWGDEFGMLTDQFGFVWMVNIASSAA